MVRQQCQRNLNSQSAHTESQTCRKKSRSGDHENTSTSGSVASNHNIALLAAREHSALGKEGRTQKEEGSWSGKIQSVLRISNRIAEGIEHSVLGWVEEESVCRGTQNPVQRARETRYSWSRALRTALLGA